ncbi:MAG: type I-E CRISPR-associated protein Cas6/Cse3/CasE [Anaerolineaceae bacterium]|nr:type I-E CRISPR-associated protein Cas6/Cse3/CasE [Anaerolineaceae bacterium]
MILSKLLLSPNSRLVRKELGNQYELHRSLMSAFPNQINREAAALLYRLESSRDPLRMGIPILVQSITEPDWRSLESRTDYLFCSPVLKKVVPQPQGMQGTFRFTLRANPTQRNSQSRKLIPIQQDVQLVEWINSKASQNGFSIVDESLLIRKAPPLLIHKPENGKMLRIQIQVTDFSGLLQITDSQMFLQAWQTGIGRGKSFGCGMLSLARI